MSNYGYTYELPDPTVLFDYADNEPSDEFLQAAAYWQAHGYTIHHDGTATRSGKFLSARDVLEQWRNRDEVVPF